MTVAIEFDFFKSDVTFFQVPPLSPPNSDVNTTIASGMEKGDRKSAPVLLMLVGILTCGLALYLSWSQGRRSVPSIIQRASPSASGMRAALSA